ncbi:unnamed protein product, partial [marine sediment metagenome]
RSEGIHRQLCKQRSGDKSEEQALRTAWRQVLRWIQAQIAMIDSEIVSTEEVFMPYLQIKENGQTLFEVFQSNPKFLQLTAGSK